MAPLAHTLALLAMAMATVAIKVVPLDMAKNSFDDQYLECSKNSSEIFQELQNSDILNNSEFERNWKNWTNATAQRKNQVSVSSPLTPHEAIALMAYTMNTTTLYKQFNDAMRVAGSSSWEYRNKFHFKLLHFLLTRALQKLRHGNDCKNVFRGVKNYHFDVKQGDEVRFGQFASTSLSEKVAQGFGQDTMFKVYTCHGVDIQNFSVYPRQQEVLIPPFETFKVNCAYKEDNIMYIQLRSTGNSSNYNCEWLKGDSLSRNCPHLLGFLLATVAMAVVTSIL